MRTLLNLESLTWDGYSALQKADESLVGTYDYIGFAWYWHYAYRHYLRDASIIQRRRIHNKALDNGISFEEVEVQQFEIIKQVMKEAIPTEDEIKIEMAYYANSNYANSRWRGGRDPNP